MRVLTAVVPAHREGATARSFLQRDLGLTYHQVSRLKAWQGLKVNQAPVHTDFRLTAGDRIEVILADPERPAVPAEDLPVRIVWEDADLCVIDKPAPLPCQATPRQPSGTLENRLAWHYRADKGFVFRPLNRLDKGTSGLMAAAKHAVACSRLQAQLHTDSFAREYLAIVEGSLRGSGRIELPIAKADGASIRRVVDVSRGQWAATDFCSLGAFGRRSLIRLRLLTGRTHQIRVHLSHIGHPIVGDFLYGTETDELPGRFALHSCRLSFTHPFTGEVVSLDSPLPEELRRLIT